MSENKNFSEEFIPQEQESNPTEETTENEKNTENKEYSEAILSEPIPVWNIPTPVDAVTLQKKKDIKWVANAIGVALCLQLFLIFAIDNFVAATLKVIGSNELNRLFFLPTVKRLYGAAKSLLIMTVPFFLTTSLTRLSFSEIVKFNKPKKNTSLTIIMLGVGVCAIANVATSIFASVFESFFGVPVEGAPSVVGDGVPFAISFLCIGIIPAIIEEFAFRGVILGTLRKYTSDGFSIFLSAVVFALVHGNLQQIPFAFIVGLILGFTVVYTGSIFPAMIIHFLNNSLSVVLSHLTEGLSPQISGLIFWLYLLVLMLIGLCGLVVMLKTDEGGFHLSKEKSDDTINNAKWFFSSAFIIAFLVIISLTLLFVQFGG